jgi:hypothetical protein
MKLEKKKEIIIKLDELTEELKFVGKGLYARKSRGNVELFKRKYKVDPRKTMVSIIAVSIIIGIFIGRLLC